MVLLHFGSNPKEELHEKCCVNSPQQGIGMSGVFLNK